MAADEASAAYEELIKEQLNEERARKQSLEQRGLAVVTSSGTLVTLLFAVAALVIRPEDFGLPAVSMWFFGIAVLSFTIAGILGIFTNRPERYEEPSADWLSRLVWPSIWTASDLSLARRRAAEARLKSIRSFRKVNEKKVNLLTGAIAAEVTAVGLVAAGIIAFFV